MNKQIGIKSIGTLAAAFIIWLTYYLTQPTISFAHLGGFGFIAFTVVIIAAVVSMWLTDFDGYDFFWYPVAGTAALAFVVLIGGMIGGSSFFNADKMHNQIGKVEEIEFAEMISQIDHSQIPIVDDEFAQKQADKKMGEDIALGSRAHLGDATIQAVNGEIMYVAYLEHDSIFKWLKFKSTPGYITVSATNPNKVQYVTEIGDEKIEVVYSPDAYFDKNLKRHIRNEGYRTQALTDYTFELDDSGRPFWVVTAYDNTTVWGNPEAAGSIIVDAQTGETEYYSVEETPDWVDIIQPVDFVEKQIDNWGLYVHGWFNPSNQDEIKKTEKTLTVYSDGDCYYFTGMTSVGADESCVGFIMVNTRDKSAKICYMSGATEDAAMKSAEGIVSDYGYIATEPLPLNVNGIPTYVMSLKDSEGLVKSYAMVNIQSYNIVAKGDTLKEVSKSYVQQVAKSGQSNVVSSDEAYGYTLEGKVERISTVVEDGSTYYYIIVENEPNKIFTASYIISDELSITRDGDEVIINYIDDQNGTIDIVSFDNKSFGVTISKDQEHRDELDKGSSALDNQLNEIIKVNPEMNEEKWNSLSEEEKSKLIQEFLGA